MCKINRLKVSVRILRIFFLRYAFRSVQRVKVFPSFFLVLLKHEIIGVTTLSEMTYDSSQSEAKRNNLKFHGALDLPCGE